VLLDVVGRGQTIAIEKQHARGGGGLEAVIAAAGQLKAVAGVSNELDWKWDLAREAIDDIGRYVTRAIVRNNDLHPRRDRLFGQRC
jgi:hypothetical protein